MGSMLYDAKSGENRILSPSGGFLSMQSSPRIVAARTEIVTKFLTNEDFNKSAWLVTLDSDMVWDDGAIHRMIGHAEAEDLGIVGGLCIAGGHSDMQYPTVYVATGTHDGGLPRVSRHDMSTPAMKEAVEEGAMLHVDATGAAFMAIRRDVLLHMADAFGFIGESKNPWPWYGEMIGENAEYGEDVTFCLRARQLGYTIGVDLSCRIGHVKSASLTWETYQELSNKRIALPNLEVAS